MFAFVAFDQAQEFIFKEHWGMLGKGAATQRSWKGGKDCSALAAAAPASLIRL